MRKYFLFFVLFICFFFSSNHFVYASIPINSYGIGVGEEYFIEDFYPYDFYRNGHLDFYLDNGSGGKGKYMGKMVSLQHIDTHQWGRTFAHSSTYYRWGKMMGGNPSYVRDNVKESELKRLSDGRVFIRAHSRQLAESSGALVKVLDGYSWARITPTSFPTGSLYSPSTVNLEEDFNVTFNAREYYPYSGSEINWELWFDDRFLVDQGTSSTSRISSKKIPLSLTSHGHRKMELRISDSVERETTITKNLYVNRPPVADFDESPNPTTTKDAVSFTNEASDPDGDNLSYKWDFRKEGNSNWQRFSTATNPSHRFRSLGTYEVKLTATDTYGASDTKIKEIEVENQPPNANFSMSPNPTDRISIVSFRDYSSDPENDSLTYQYHYRKKGTLSWRSLSTSSEPTHKFTCLGTYEVRLRVTDVHGDYDIKTKEIEVENLAPNAAFSASPNPTERITSVRFSNRSSDPEDDNLSYLFEYRMKGTSSWKRLSTSKNPSHTFDELGTYQVRLRVTDTYGAKDYVTKEIEVENISPEVKVNYNPSPVYEGDDVDICVTPTDEDKDPLKITLHIQKEGGSSQKLLEMSNLDSGTEECYTVEDIEDGEYEITTTVTDGNDSETVNLTFTSRELSITGHVNHTDKWEEKHREIGNPLNHFYSGERFLLLADVVDYPIDYLNVFFEGYQLNSNLYKETVSLSANSPVTWDGELYNSDFQSGNSVLKSGLVAFDFEVKYENGTIKRDTVNVEIIGDVYDIFQIKQKY